MGRSEAVRGELTLEGSAVEIVYVMPALVNTELSAGTTQTRGVRKVEPHEVADAIVHALRHGIVDVWVPKNTRAIGKVAALLPRRGTDAVARVLKADRALYEFDAGVRREYELRAARSQPGLDPGEDAPTQLGERSGS